MVDPIQNIPGTITNSNVAGRSTSSPSNVPVSNLDNQSAQAGVSAPTPPVSAGAESNLELSSAAKRVLSSMVDLPPPIDVQAVTEIKEAISYNDYPLDYTKMASKLLENLETLK